ncbi:ABC transporter A family member 8 [Acorus gramineus]|uniref:ABC transporter A family member 8 n=1 Tax=Acorus gramineus TaxID=55184 RepID=A0AAV9A2G6_ACOGR|nr:ABC transporter A family member 8 [Acorus gramineus]
MMKIHGLSDRAYWMVTYTYFLAISSLYMVWFTAIGSTIGLDIFLLNSYGIQFVFYLLYLNLQISLAFLAATGFSEVKIASVVAYIYVFRSGLLGAYLFQYYIEDTTLPSKQITSICYSNLGKRCMGKDGRLKKQALQSLYLAIQSGECFGMLGPSGSGKSTFINMVSVNIFYLFQTFHGTTFSLMLILTLRASMNNALSNELSTYQMKT